MSPLHLDQAPDHRTLRILRESDLIQPDGYWAALRDLNPAEDWARYASRLLLLIGAALVLAAVIFFFAYNWDGLGRWPKLGILQGSVVLALVAGQAVGFTKLGGQLLLLAAAILIGVCLAVFGQVYQTGADAFGFFAVWALLLLPWAFASAFAPIWVLLFILINSTVFFFWAQVGQFHVQFHYVYACAALALTNGIGLWLRERLYPSRPWLQGGWLRPLFLLGTTIPLSLPAYEMASELNPDHRLLAVGTLLWAGALGGAFITYRFQRFDTTCLSLVLANAAIFLLVVLGQLLGDADLYDDGFGFLIMTGATIGLAVLLVKVIRSIRDAQLINEDPSI